MTNRTETMTTGGIPVSELPGYEAHSLAGALILIKEQAAIIDQQASELAALKAERDWLLRVQGWQSIESAPEWTPVLLFARCLTAESPGICVGWKFENAGWVELAYLPNKPIGLIPTHWMPFPQPPEQVKPDGGDGQPTDASQTEGDK